MLKQRLNLLLILFFSFIAIVNSKGSEVNLTIDIEPIVDSLNYFRSQENWDAFHRQLDKLIRVKELEEKQLLKTLEQQEQLLSAMGAKSEAGYVWNFAGKKNAIAGAFEAAIPYYDKAIKLLKASNDSLYLHLIYYYQAQVVIMGTNDHAKAIESSTEAIRLYKRKGELEKKQLGKLYYPKGWGYRGLYQYEEALEAFNTAIAMTGDADGYYETFKCRTYLEMGKPQEALASAELADQKFTKDEGKRNHEYLLLIGRAKARLGHYKEAEKIVNQAVLLGEKSYGKNHSEYIKLFYFLAIIQSQANKTKAALASCNKVFNLSYPDFQSDDIYSSPEIKGPSPNLWVLDALILQGKLLNQLSFKEQNTDYIKSALNAFNEGINDVAKRRAALKSWTSKQRFNKYAFGAYDGAIESSLILSEEQSRPDKKNAVLCYMEKSRSILIKSYQKEKAAQEDCLPTEISLRINHLEKEIAQIEKNYYLALEEEDEARVEVINKELMDARLEWNFLVEPYEVEESKFIGSFDENNVSTDHVQSSLDAEQAILMYYQLDSSLISIFISADIFDIKQIHVGDGFKSNIAKFSNAISNWETIQTDFGKAKNSYDTLSGLLGDELLTQLNLSKNPISELKIIPHGVLFNVPFETLKWKDKLLLESMPVHYALSLEKSYEKRSNDGEVQKMFAGFAPRYGTPALEGATLGEGGPPINLRGNLNDIPETRVALLKLSKLFDGKIWMEKEASKASFIKNAPEYRILHLAMHGKVHEGESKLSKLYFNEEESSGLTIREIQAMDLNADLVVLSACETNVGTLKKGEGPMSLAYAFQYAGAKSVLSSLWSVPDLQTSKIMVEFYRQLKFGLNKSGALQKAKLKYLENAVGMERHPSFWAGFIILGEDAPIRYSTFNYAYLLWVGLGLLILIFLAKQFGIGFKQ